MKKRLWFLISILIAAALSFALAGCASEGEPGYTGTVYYSWLTPQYLSTQGGYYEGNQTITMENGIATKAEAEMVLNTGDGYVGISLITVMHSSKSGSTKGIFRDVTSAKMYCNVTYPFTYGDPVTKVPIESPYLWAESSIVWSGEDLTEMTVIQGAIVLAKMSFDYEGGRRKAMRIYNTVLGYYDKAEYYKSWDSTWDIPTEIWQFLGGVNIPAGYDYVENSIPLSRIGDQKHEITLDGQGRIFKLVESQGVDPEYSPIALYVYTYDGDSQTISGMTWYEVYFEGDPTNPDNWDGAVLSMTFDLPSESGFEMQEMMLEPMQMLFLPFTYQDEIFLSSL